ncbi:hypothetical protein C8J57DRAFT_1253650 [Mycena rebaudengoi]|nr:hypothetical protein C8J57DRAFT_1253650 [Mycena rebaudengoi]
MAKGEDQMKPKPTAQGSAQDMEPPGIQAKGLEFKDIKHDEDIFAHCRQMAFFFKDNKGELIDIAVYEASHPLVLHNGEMIGLGSTAPMGWIRGSGYAPVQGFEAESLDGIDTVFNEIEDVTVMLETMHGFHPDAH